MKEIKLSKCEWTEIEKVHLEYCRSKITSKVPSLTQEQEELLFIKNPFNKRMKIKIDYLPLRKIDLQNEYENFTSYKKEWCRYKLIKALNIDVCPYCGQQYFSVVKNKDDAIIAEATFDHYFDKATYPFLALNLYNLIPVCKNCNTSFKSTRPEKVINPHFKALENNIRFKIVNHQISNYLEEEELDLIVENLAVGQDFDLVENHLDVLCIKDRYKYYQGIIRSIIYKRQSYENGRIKELINLMDDMGFNITEQEIENMLINQDIFGENEPFQKFKKDIWIQLSSCL